MLMNGERVGNERNRRGKGGREVVVVVVRKLAIQFWQLRFCRRKKKKKIFRAESFYQLTALCHLVSFACSQPTLMLHYYRDTTY